MPPQTKEVAKTEPKPIDTIRGLLMKSKAQIAAALPRHVSADRMLRVAVTACQKTPKLLDCRPISLVGAIIQCAQLGLEPNDGTGKAWLVPYKTEAVFIAGYRGLVDLARRSGEIKRFDARVVREKDDFSYSFGAHPDLKHVPSRGDAGEISYVYAVAEFKDGGIQFDVMTREEVEKIRKRSSAGLNGPWQTDYAEMAKKTVVRRLCKMLPVSAETQRAVTLDEQSELGLPQNLAMLADPNETPMTAPGKTVPMPQPARKASAASQDAPGLIEADKTTNGAAGAKTTVSGVVGGVARTQLKGVDYFVIRIGDKKVYTAETAAADDARVSGEDGAKVSVNVETIDGLLHLISDVKISS